MCTHCRRPQVYPLHLIHPKEVGGPLLPCPLLEGRGANQRLAVTLDLQVHWIPPIKVCHSACDIRMCCDHVLTVVGFTKGYGGGSSWPPGNPYGAMPPGMQMSPMGGVGAGHMNPRGYPMGMSHDQQQQLRMHQEQMIQAQQARRMQQQQAVAGGGGAMYGVPPSQQPQGPGMMGHSLSRPPPQVGMPPGYPMPPAPTGKSPGSRSTKML